MLKKAFLIKQEDKLVCFNCGKECVKHREHRAHELVNKEEPISEDDILYYTLEDVKTEIKLEVHNKEKVVFTICFNSNGILNFYGEETLDYWLELISQNFLYNNYKNKERFLSFTDDECKIINKYFPSVYKINNIGYFLKTIQKRKFVKKQIDETMFNKIPYGKINLSVGNKYNKYKNIAKVKLKEFEVDNEIILEVIYAIGEVEDAKIINPKKYRFFISKDYIYNPKNYDLSEIIGNKDIVYIYEQTYFPKFLKKYPELMIKEFINGGGKDLVRFILSNNNDSVYELLGKAGLGYIAEAYEFNCDKYIKNIKDLYQMPIKSLRSLNSENGVDLLKEKENEIIALYKEYPAMFAEKINRSGLRFISEFNFYKRCFDKNIVKYFRYINSLDMECCDLYIDYMRMCRSHNLYPYGKFPKAIQVAHDTMMIYDKEKTEAQRAALRETGFKNAVESNRYKNLIYSIGDYEFLIPRQADDLVKESYQMRNCVRSYIESVARGTTYIVFLRKKERLASSFVTIEVYGTYKLGQVKGRANSTITSDIADIVMKWCDEKNINYKYNWDLEKALNKAA